MLRIRVRALSSRELRVDTYMNMAVTAPRVVG